MAFIDPDFRTLEDSERKTKETGLTASLKVAGKFLRVTWYPHDGGFWRYRHGSNPITREEADKLTKEFLNGS